MRLYRNRKIKYVIDFEYYWNTFKVHSYSSNELRDNTLGLKVFTILPSLCITSPVWMGKTHNSKQISSIVSFLTFWCKLSIYYHFTPLQKLENAKIVEPAIQVPNK
jgi:hypothetical protein